MKNNYRIFIGLKLSGYLTQTIPMIKSTIQDKANLVNSVFSKVYRKYDLMNDVMSFGVHRLWKKNLIDWMKPQPNTFLIDVASGTGDLAHIFSKKTNYKSKQSFIKWF